MRYLKLYESFDSDLEDILLEITDMGYSYSIDKYNKHYIVIYKIAPQDHVSRYEDMRQYDIKDCLLRLKDYLGDNYIGCKIMYYDNNNKARYELFNLTEECDLKSPVGIIIDYRK
jgi:hypothetical protein